MIFNYNELVRMISQKSGKNLAFSTVDSKTVKIGMDLPFKIPFMSPNGFGIDVTVDRIWDNDLYLAFGGGNSLIADGLLRALNKPWLCEKSDTGVVVHLDRAEQLRPVLEKVRINDIQFIPDAVLLDFQLKI